MHTLQGIAGLRYSRLWACSGQRRLNRAFIRHSRLASIDRHMEACSGAGALAAFLESMRAIPLSDAA
jgi:hypothetical protein